VTDQELLDLLMEEGRAYLATIRAAKQRDAHAYTAGRKATAEDYQAARDLLGKWNQARDALRAAVIDRLESESAARN
jgi:hypothetical protein